MAYGLVRVTDTDADCKQSSVSLVVQYRQRVSNAPTRILVVESNRMLMLVRMIRGELDDVLLRLAKVDQCRRRLVMMVQLSADYLPAQVAKRGVKDDGQRVVIE